MTTKEIRAEAHKEITYIFEELLPEHGLPHRPEQVKLSHLMLDAMIEGKIALCDAGTGIGKTFSYLVAGTVYNHYRTRNKMPRQSLIISTSSIALQTAVKYEYLPFLSAVLLDDGIIKKPILAVIRKGKSHYVCDERLEQRFQQLEQSKRNPNAMEALKSLRANLDLDEAEHLTNFDRRQVCVPEVCDCKREYCRYKDYMKQCSSKRYLFQICNHNLFLADAMHRGERRRPIFPEYSALVMDESHKLPEVAREMFGVTLSAEDIQSTIYALKMERYLLAAEYLADAAEPLLALLTQPPEERPFSEYAHLLLIPYQVLKTIQKQLCKNLSHLFRRNLDKLISTISTLLRYDQEDNLVCYGTESDSGGTLLCATVFDLAGPMKKIIWRQPQGMVLTSGTLAVKENFSRFREEVGIQHNGRVTESVSLSPFDYAHHCLLYFPDYPPRQFGANQELYYDALADEIARLVDASTGHALVLFTSYSAMSAVKERLAEMQLLYPLFTLDRNKAHALEAFRAHPGAILLATGAAWEGMDFPGDGVSLLVIPRLPFAFPNELREKQLAHYESVHDFIQSVIVPEMQIKLRQGFGRAIRTETDTCVVAILDDRAGDGERYHDAVLDALPVMPRTSLLEDVEQFMLDHKPDRYFKELKQAEWDKM